MPKGKERLSGEPSDELIKDLRAVPEMCPDNPLGRAILTMVIIEEALEEERPEKIKIDPDFAARVARLGPKEKVGVVVLLDTSSVVGSASKRQSPEERQATVNAVREAAGQNLGGVDEILESCGGQRLTNPDAVGSILVETTAAGIKSLVESDWVRAVQENEKIP